MRIRRAAAALVLGAAALPGCYVLRTVTPLDASGMAFPADWASDAVADQWARTRDGVAGLPATIGSHFHWSWRHLTEDPAAAW